MDPAGLTPPCSVPAAWQHPPLLSSNSFPGPLPEAASSYVFHGNDTLTRRHCQVRTLTEFRTIDPFSQHRIAPLSAETRLLLLIDAGLQSLPTCHRRMGDATLDHPYDRRWIARLTRTCSLSPTRHPCPRIPFLPSILTALAPSCRIPSPFTNTSPAAGVCRPRPWSIQWKSDTSHLHPRGREPHSPLPVNICRGWK